MRTLFKVVITLAIVTNVVVNGYDCARSFADQVDTSCDSSRSYSYQNVALSLSNSQQTLTIYADIRLNDNCGSNQVDLIFLTVGPNAKNTIGLVYDVNTKFFLYTFGSNHGDFGVNGIDMRQEWISVAIAVNLNSGDLRLAFWSRGSSNFVAKTLPELTGFYIDSNARLRICGAQGSETNNAVGTYSCTVRNFKAVYNFISDPYMLIKMDRTVLIGSYQFLEGIGSTSQNSVTPDSNSSVALFGNGALDTQNSPGWIMPGPGLSFTDLSQLVTISNLDWTGIIPSSQFSLGVSVWLKFDSSMTSAQKFFRFVFGGSLNEFASVTLDSDMMIYTNLLSSGYLPGPVTKGVWTQLTFMMYASFIGVNGNECFTIVYFGSVLRGSQKDACSYVPNDNSYKLIIQGLVGQVQDLQIFRTPAPIVNSPSCSPTVVTSLGSSNPEISLMRSECTNGLPRSSTTACYACSNLCTSCIDSDQCLTCKPGYYLGNGATCVQCPVNSYATSRTATTCSGTCGDGCSACLDSTTCIVCAPGYSLQGATCSKCGTGTYSHSGDASSCLGICPSKCDTCTSDTECQTCKAGFGLVDDMCRKCPDGSYPTSTSCESCPDTCSTCTDLQTCDTCKDGFGLVNGGCERCPAGTYATPTACLPGTNPNATPTPTPSNNNDNTTTNNNNTTSTTNSTKNGNSTKSNTAIHQGEGSNNNVVTVVIGLVSMVIVGAIVYVISQHMKQKGDDDEDDKDDEPEAIDNRSLELTSKFVDKAPRDSAPTYQL